ncbi:histidinol dehydrogenase [Heyndrickxia coagulans]|uniref:Histidinol dehydrogenase n=1 Tax=Heyndrickxia coagulans DSM 1 = ATCC 7050 TaxID=1121088 RepID=A0A8B4BTQ7_HEYCO|nr:histidinol dehydrogenase [Heyndrickxia coagulans]AJH79222.1 histidinol dehydrogenase [Heyndrickxia coagulans DSM 1 = ATCC 7050]MBF8418219.1 histidinol dehydrogenase [Heyndrickxia coagulans]MCR2845665.1 histidinol dehydrogenase [Heyndrickxia coagulans]MDR4223324.1 histidinol dehydrogenase [Heyndrickxia coagulans DSM 1 = ATCC 7050]MED4493619.1 histidinol dehydrogenase [Heyndrickxia coagulans]
MIREYTKKAFAETFLQSKNKSGTHDEDVLRTAKEVLEDIRLNGDAAVKKYAAQFDGEVPEPWEVSPEERIQAWREVPQDVISALQKAAENIRRFHAKQLQNSRIMEMNENIISGQLFRPVEKAGIYVPGGTACYPSSVLMNAIPAVLAGVEEVVMATPARNGTKIAPVLSVAADIAGVGTIYKLGGIQAIGALAYGTETIPAVDKIAGPGNAYVAAAKSLVYGTAGIDLIAGPSEVAIIADENANPAYIAADLIAQAEHDERARTFLLTTSQKLINETKAELEKQLVVLPRRGIAEVSIKMQSAAVLVASIDEAFALSNRLAPEHLEIQVENPLLQLSKVKNAGSVFLGENTPEAIGDYYGGPNHVLPTSGTARFSSGLSVDDFYKKITYLYYGEKALQQAAPDVMAIAAQERLEGHARAVQKRVKG